MYLGERSRKREKEQPQRPNTLSHQSNKAYQIQSNLYSVLVNSNNFKTTFSYYLERYLLQMPKKNRHSSIWKKEATENKTVKHATINASVHFISFIIKMIISITTAKIIIHFLIVTPRIQFISVVFIHKLHICCQISYSRHIFFTVSIDY